MSLAQSIQTAWAKQSKWLVVLRPLSWLYRALSSLNKWAYQHGVKKAYTAPVPVMVIGNITVGGSGKTPLLIALVQYLQKNHVKVGVISRGYGGQGPFPYYVNHQALPQNVGDEPCLIVQSTAVPLVVGANRKENIELLLSKCQLDLIISDDGLQHYALNRQLEWIVFDANRGLGNEKILPEGYLREPKQRLNTATVIEHAQHAQSELNMQLAAGQPYLLNQQQNKIFNPKQKFYAVVGIGYPQRFYATLKSIGINDFEQHEFVDHHAYQIEDLKTLTDHAIITTEKDAVKLRALLSEYSDFKLEIWVLPVQAILSEACYLTLNRQLQQLGIEIL